ncbi:transporter of NadC family protein [Psychromonas ingrahamii 37]|uniref:Transporter of NadC family protein n=1 Tax=Psychromonas ingrahamii (strain DSM 17664 / CCUG 51855 / 37) TaxID=357804 RepID=A1SS32_PSYIN|nr:MATE family efflux transporter [Psychromonas ingrahamii]ABM02297.1 transporter of NadC family protein [Psychromonas ingrahamii 37]
MTTDSLGKTKEDLTGQDRFAWNLMVSWVSQLVLVFSGFIMPRLVDDKVGQDLLGIWDFGWSFVSYLSLVGLGMGACFNRYIAKHRSSGDFFSLNKVANSAVFVQLIFSTVTALCTISFYLLLPIYFSDVLQENIATAQWVVLFLGLSVSVQMIAGSASGLLTGYHRWDIHNALHAGDSFFSLILMVIALYFTDLNVAGMAIGYLLSTILFETLRFVFVNKLCKEFKFDLRMANFISCKEMLVFGIKSMLSNVPPILLLQTISIMLVSAIGPAALAVFARPMALTKQVKTFMTKFTLMLTPTTSSMQGSGDIKAIQSLFISTTKLSFAFTLPSLGFLFIYGDVVLYYWMGSEYALSSLVMILALGQVLPMGQDTSIRILMGMNQHGRISLFAFISVFAFFAVGLLFSGVNDWELTTAALLFVVPMNIVYGLIVPIYTCRELELSWFSYVQSSFIRPVIYVIPFLALLYWSRQAFEAKDIITASVTFFFAGIVTIIIYFVYLVPNKMQQKLLLRCKFQ